MTKATPCDHVDYSWFVSPQLGGNFGQRVTAVTPMTWERQRTTMAKATLSEHVDYIWFEPPQLEGNFGQRVSTVDPDADGSEVSGRSPSARTTTSQEAWSLTAFGQSIGTAHLEADYGDTGGLEVSERSPSARTTTRRVAWRLTAAMTWKEKHYYDESYPL